MRFFFDNNLSPYLAKALDALCGPVEVVDGGDLTDELLDLLDDGSEETV